MAARDLAVNGFKAETAGVTFRVDVPLGDRVRVGAMGGYRKLDGNLAYGAPLEATAWTTGIYAAAELASGFYAQASFTLSDARE